MENFQNFKIYKGTSTMEQMEQSWRNIPKI